MPHCILEYSGNLPEIPDFQILFQQLHEVLMASGHFTLDDIKSRAIRHEVFLIGDGDPRRTFIAMNLCLLSGRSDEVKTELARSVGELLERAFARTMAETSCSLTVQVSELHRPSYHKIVSRGSMRDGCAVVMPQLGKSIEKGTVTKWLVKVGDRVERDQPLFEISTDKVDAEIPSPASGVLRQIFHPVGATVPVNTAVAWIEPYPGIRSAV